MYFTNYLSLYFTPKILIPLILRNINMVYNPLKLFIQINASDIPKYHIKFTMNDTLIRTF